MKLPPTSAGVSAVDIRRRRKEESRRNKLACVGAARSPNAAHTDVGEDYVAQLPAALAACGVQVLLPSETVLLDCCRGYELDALFDNGRCGHGMPLAIIATSVF